MALTFTAVVYASFEGSDGNLTSPSGEDWENAPTLIVAKDKPSGKSDDSLSGKEDAEYSGVVHGSIPKNKSDLLRFYLATEQVLDSNLEVQDYLYLAWIRSDTLGSANMDFEFNQLPASPSVGNGVTPEREDGDMLITFELGSGGNEAVLGLSRWIPDAGSDWYNAVNPCEAANSPPCWSPIQPLSGVASGSVNDVSVMDPIPCQNTDPDIDLTEYCVDGTTTLEPFTFGEAAINLSAAGVLNSATDCINFGSAYVKSRSSDSFTASLKDFIAPVGITVNNCGSITVVKEAEPFGEAQDFRFSTDLTSTDPNARTAGDARAFLDGLPWIMTRDRLLPAGKPSCCFPALTP